MLRMVAVCVGLIALAGNAIGQPRMMERSEGPQFIFFEAINLVSANPEKSRVDVPYRINDGFFVPVRNTDPALSSPFRKRGEILVELLDSTGTSAARDIDRVQIGAESSEQPVDRQTWYQGIVSFNVPPGKYTLIFDVEDLESERKFLSDKTSVVARKFGPKFEASTPVFIDLPDADKTPEHLTIQNWGRDLQFGRKGALLVELISQELQKGTVEAEYTIAVKERPDDSPVTVLSDTLRDITPLRTSSLLPVRSGAAVGYNLATTEQERSIAVVIPIGAERLPLRTFELTATIRRGDKNATLTKTFRTFWPDMPMSLRDVDYALESLRPITTEEQRDSLKRGSIEERRNHLEQFWQEKDRTPGTAYNEVQAEYYRRVDHARRAFGTLREPDGSLSDRGRIFILHGQPGTINRTLDPSAGYQEEWVYENLSKRFIFADKTKSGNYILVSSQSL